MARLEYVPVNVERGFPQRFECRVAGALLGFEFRYNAEGNFYTADIFDSDEQLIVFGKPVVYGSDLLADLIHDGLPAASLVALDLAGKETHAGKGVFGVDVQLWIVERDVA